MKIKYLLIFSAIFSAFVLSGDDAAETPMQLFKEFRQAIIANDTAKVLELTGDKLLEDVRNNGVIPIALRGEILFVEAAYEEVDIRFAAPENALVNAFVMQDGKLRRLEIKMANNVNGVRKIISITDLPHSPEPAVEKFISSGKTKRLEQFHAALTPELAKEFAAIPDFLQMTGSEGEEIKYKAGRITADIGSYSIDSFGIKGNIQVKKQGYFWKITAIDPILTAPSPASVIKNFCTEITAAMQNQEELKNFLIEKNLEKIKTEDLTESMLPRIAAFQNCSGQKSAGNKSVLVNALIDNETECGTLQFTMNFETDRWLIADIAAPDLIYPKSASPEKIAEKFVAAWEKEANKDNAKELASEKFLNSLEKKDAEPEVTSEIISENIDGASATVTVNLTNSKAPGKREYTLALQKGKWIITAQKIIPEEKAPEETAETPAPAPAEEPK